MTGRRRLALVAGVLVVLLGGLGAWAAWTRLSDRNGQALKIAGMDTDAAYPPAAPRTSDPSGPPFVTSVAPGGRYLLDQYGKPLLIQGDSPWALMTKASPAQAGLWFADRQRHGVNAAIVSLIGATGNGGPADDGSTLDGLKPFVAGDILKWQEPYWKRMDSYVRMAADHGITLMLYPIDGWTIGKSFVPTSIDQCTAYGTKLAQRYGRAPNIVWISGGDYFPATDDLAAGSDVDHCIDATVRGLRAAGDPHLFSMQLGYPKSLSTDNPYWASRIDWNFVYSYYPTYRAVLQAYRRDPAMPALLGEAHYEGENDLSDKALTTDLMLRRQMLWALTSGAAGAFFGSDDWEFHPGWENRLDTPAVTQLQRLHDYLAGLRWWQLVPDTGDDLVTAGRGTYLTTDQRVDVSQNDYVTVARTPDRRLSVVYLPSARTISLDLDALPAGTKATWVDPTTGTGRRTAPSATMTSPGRNAGGDGDWLLVLRS